MSKRDYYEVLGLGKNATNTEIKAAYRRAAQKYHPDRNPDDATAEESFKEAKEAYEVLSDPGKRAAYERHGHAGPQQRGPGDMPNFDDVIRAARAAAAGMGGAGMNQFTQQIAVPIDILINGGSITTQIMVPVSTGQFGQIRLDSESFTINIEKDTAPGTVIKAIVNNGVEVTLVLSPASIKGFMAHGIDIVKKLEINVIEALVGTKTEFTHLDGKTIRGDVPAGVTDGTPLRIQGRGLANPMGGRGDLIVVIQLTMPVLDSEQMELAKELAEKLK